MAAIGVALWWYVMGYAPHTPDFFNRDRFVLSNGHACLLQYCFLHLTGYKAMAFEQLNPTILIGIMRYVLAILRSEMLWLALIPPKRIRALLAHCFR
jgi:hypothetical protein